MSIFRRRLMGVSRKGSDIDMSNYMTIEALEDGLRVRLTRTVCEYSIDGGEWVRLGVDTYTPAINTGQIVSFKANNPTANSSYGIGTFTITKQCNLKGNCMSMLAYDDAANMTTVKQHGFRTLFKNCTNIINVEKGFLPATTLNDNCYQQMFYGCSNLTTAPELPAKILKSNCYREMFYRCGKLEIPPALPATTLQEYCYRNMFYACNSIKTAPELPATTLAEYCYAGMFYGCNSLVEAPNLPTTTLANYCYYQMFYTCSNLVNPPIVAASKLGIYSCREMFNGCKSLISTPSMNINSVNTYSCYSMFEGCTNLTTINMTISASYFYESSCTEMFNGCTKLVDASSLFVLKSDSVLGNNCFNSMFYGCTKLTATPSIPSLNLAVGCYANMFYNCSSLTNVPELPATTLAQECYYRMFFGCSKIYSVVLPALELVEDCYGQMFYNCGRLSEITALFLTEPSTTYTNQWVYGVNGWSGTFTKNKDATWNIIGDYAIPNANWTVVTV